MTAEKGSRRENQRLMQVGRNVGHLVHQLRSPVVTIGLAADSLRGRPGLGDEARGELDQIIEHVGTLESMLQDCLGYLRPSRGGGERVNVANLIHWLTSAVMIEAEQAGVSIVATVPDDLPTITGHRRLLRQALLNVARNALEASTRNKGTVTVNARRTARHVVVEVADTGKGMTPTALRRAFEPFYTQKASGVGLGLPVARKLVEDHGGRVVIDSAPGEGTRVRLRLPFAGSDPA